MSDLEFYGTLAAFAVGIIALFWLVVKRHFIMRLLGFRNAQARAKKVYTAGGKAQMKARPIDPWSQVNPRRK